MTGPVFKRVAFSKLESSLSAVGYLSSYNVVVKHKAEVFYTVAFNERN